MNHKLTHYQGVMLIKLNHELDRNKDLPKKKTAKRGNATFSRKSRKNLLQQILKLENKPGYYFVTLTYPKEYEKNFETWKKQLHQLYSSLHYHYLSMGFLWKLEFQQRGAPHFHLLMYNPSIPHVKELRQLIKNSWYRIVGTKSKSFRHHGTDVQEVKNIKASGFYLAMYQTKDGYTPKDLKTGRPWGMYGRKQMPITEQGSASLNEQQYTLLKRICRKWLLKQPNSQSYANYLKNRVGSFQIFMPNYEQHRLMNWIVSRAIPGQSKAHDIICNKS